jgi:hypothetical protein
MAATLFVCSSAYARPSDSFQAEAVEIALQGGSVDVVISDTDDRVVVSYAPGADKVSAAIAYRGETRTVVVSGLARTVAAFKMARVVVSIPKGTQVTFVTGDAVTASVKGGTQFDMEAGNGTWLAAIEKDLHATFRQVQAKQ